ncbi:MAG: hypothetical protein H0W23_03385 [Chloroflexia bacterium]|nr:hypothetical protein [Chloroflexia bacterium]
MNEPEPEPGSWVGFGSSGTTGVTRSSVEATLPTPESSGSPVDCGAGVSTATSGGAGAVDDTARSCVTGATVGAGAACAFDTTRSRVTGATFGAGEDDTARSGDISVTGATGGCPASAIGVGSGAAGRTVSIAPGSVFLADWPSLTPTIGAAAFSTNERARPPNERVSPDDVSFPLPFPFDAVEASVSRDAFDARETWASEARDALATDALDGLVASHALDIVDEAELAEAVAVPVAVEALAELSLLMPRRFDSIVRSSRPERGDFHNAAAAPPTPPRTDPVMNAVLCRCRATVQLLDDRRRLLNEYSHTLRRVNKRLPHLMARTACRITGVLFAHRRRILATLRAPAAIALPPACHYTGTMVRGATGS